MSDEALCDALMRMATDSQFRSAVRANERAVLAGLDLTDDEVRTLRSVSSQSSLFRGGTLSALHLSDSDDDPSESPPIGEPAP
jgi:hypothetical protein